MSIPVRKTSQTYFIGYGVDHSDERDVYRGYHKIMCSGTVGDCTGASTLG